MPATANDPTPDKDWDTDNAAVSKSQVQQLHSLANVREAPFADEQAYGIPILVDDDIGFPDFSDVWSAYPNDLSTGIDLVGSTLEGNSTSACYASSFIVDTPTNFDSSPTPTMKNLSFSLGVETSTTDRNGDTMLPNRRQPRLPGHYFCPQPSCFLVFDTRGDMNKHARSHIPEWRRKFKCPDCNKGFNDARDLRRHRNRKTKCRETAHRRETSQLNASCTTRTTASTQPANEQ